MSKDTKLPPSFVGLSGRFYVRIPRIAGGHHQRTAVYSSVNAYDSRSEVPFYVDATDVQDDFSHEIKIYAENLKTIPPDYEPDHDETDLGLTAKIEYPQRNAWKERFTQTSRRYA